MNFITKHYRWILPLCFGAASGVLAILLHYAGFLSNVAAWRESNAFWMAGGFVTPIAIWAVNIYPTKVGVIGYSFLIGLVAAFLATYLDIYILQWWAGDDRFHLLLLKGTTIERLFISISVILPIIIVAAANKRIYELESRFSRQAGAEGLLREAELFKLRQQLQPHFLYNSLNAINALVLIDPDKAQEMVGRLADFLRASVRKESNDLQAVEEELVYLEAYLAIESVRFGDRLQVVYNKQYTDDARMPPFLLQPLIENAIKFGLNGQSGVVYITFDIYLDDRTLILTITNPFDPLTSPARGTGFGLEGVRRRLYLLYGRDDLVQTSQETNLFITTLKIPQLHA